MFNYNGVTQKYLYLDVEGQGGNDEVSRKE
jgi:hypothetical protein